MSSTASARPAPLALEFHGIRYQIADVARAVAFYTERLGFTVKHQQLPAFAAVTLGECTLLLSGPGASGSRPMPDGRRQDPGGFNRVVLSVTDLDRAVAVLKDAGVRFRNEVQRGPGGAQVQIEDPDGNPSCSSPRPASPCRSTRRAPAR
jgi:glyoxylase I family protein